jgi:hypothetical protein
MCAENPLAIIGKAVVDVIKIVIIVVVVVGVVCILGCAACCFFAARKGAQGARFF